MRKFSVIVAGAATGLLAFGSQVLLRRKRQANQHIEEQWKSIIEGERQAASQFVPSARAFIQQQAKKEHYDILVIGGGATGVGCALEAALKGLRVICVEKGDWASQTSSKSTKLIHGGVRYLEKAFRNLDYAQWELVKEALKERSVLLRLAPFIASEIPIMLPVYSWLQVPYYWFGSKVYDFLAGSQSLSPSYFIGKATSLEHIPTLKSEGLCGSIVYFDGQQNDARMNIALAMTADFHGARMLNYHNVVELVKNEFGQLSGAIVEDVQSGCRFPIQAKCIINATGPFCDSIRQMDDQKVGKIIKASEGTHVVLPIAFGSKQYGLIDPSTEDERVLFMLPWNGHLVVGTTDNAIEVQENPQPQSKEIEYILSELGKRLGSVNKKLEKHHILASWTGIRPLVDLVGSKGEGKNTKSLVRSHYIEASDSGLVTITGGKWTTYRKMAEDTIAFVCKKFGFSTDNSRSSEFAPILGTHFWKRNLPDELIRNYGLPEDIALHLSQTYGDRAEKVLASLKNPIKCGDDWKSERIHPEFPYLQAEIVYSLRNEYALTCVDILARRTRISFLNCKAAQQSVPKIIEIMSKELGWTVERKKAEYSNALEFLNSMGLSVTESFQQAMNNQVVNNQNENDSLALAPGFTTIEISSS